VLSNAGGSDLPRAQNRWGLSSIALVPSCTPGKIRTCDICLRKTRDTNIRDVTDDTSIYRPSAYLEAARTGVGRIGGDPEVYVHSHVRQLEVLRRAGRVECIMRNAGGIEWGFGRKRGPGL
jgi:hypothetical protein